jgi:CheY-like chemotaxis protein
MSTILLVGNDPLRGFFYKSILERRFRHVQRMADPAEVLCLVEQPQLAANLALVISDLTLPGMGNAAFVAELHERLPEVPILALGNLGETPLAEAADSLRFLARPFGGEEILAAVDDLLYRPSREAA